MKNIIFCLMASLLFSIGDMAHVGFHIAQYPSWSGPLFYNIPSWVPLEFFFSALLLIKTSGIRKKIFHLSDLPSKKLFVVLLSLLWTMLIYLGSSFLPESIYVTKNVILFCMLLVQIIYFKIFDLPSLCEILLIALCGYGFEFFLGQIHVFNYLPSPSLIATIPLWLGFIYGSVTVTLRIFNSLE